MIRQETTGNARIPDLAITDLSKDVSQACADTDGRTHAEYGPLVEGSGEWVGQLVVATGQSCGKDR